MAAAARLVTPGERYENTASAASAFCTFFFYFHKHWVGSFQSLVICVKVWFGSFQFHLPSLKSENRPAQLTLLWWIEARFQAVEKLIKAQLPVRVLVRELDEGVDTQAPGKRKDTETQTVKSALYAERNIVQVEINILSFSSESGAFWPKVSPC